MKFHEWKITDDYKAKQYRIRENAGVEGNPDNFQIAASIAFDAGVEEGKRQAALILSELVIRGIPKSGVQFK